MPKHDFFISYASQDHDKYIKPLTAALHRKGLSFWLDRTQIEWADNIATKISNGLADSRFVILCLSSNFLGRPWPETEFGSALATQNTDGIKRVLPLILNSKTKVLSKYPLLSAFAYREFSAGVGQLADELAVLLRGNSHIPGGLRVKAESVHKADTYETTVESRISIRLLAEKLATGLGLSTEVDAGAVKPFRLRWALVDVQAEDLWRGLARIEQRRIWAMIMSDHGLRISYSDRDRLEELSLCDGTLFHLYPVEDELMLGPDSAAKMGY